MKTVFLTIPTHIFTSDLLRTEYIKYLSSKYKVFVFTPFISKEFARKENYFQSENITYVKYKTESPRFWAFFKFLRISLVNEFDWLKSIEYWYRRPNYTENKKRRLLRFLGLPFKKILTTKFFTKIEKLIYPKPKKLSKFFNQYSPDIIVTTTPGFQPWEVPFILEAQKRKIPTVAVNFTWDNLTMNAKHMRKTDYLIAWNSVMKKEAIDVHSYPQEKIFVSGTPRFDPYFAEDKKDPGREEFLKSKGLNPEHKTIFHTTVTKAYPFQKKYISDLISLREKAEIPYVNFLFRIHPLDLPETYEEFLSTPDCHFETAGEGFVDEDGAKRIEMTYDDLLNLKYSLKYTDINVNYASTITIEACIFDKSVINIGFIDRFALAYEFNHYEPMVKAGSVRVVKTDEDLPKFINQYLDSPSLDSAGRKKIVEDYVEFTDGLSYKRSVDFIENII